MHLLECSFGSLFRFSFASYLGGGGGCLFFFLLLFFFLSFFPFVFIHAYSVNPFTAMMSVENDH